MSTIPAWLKRAWKALVSVPKGVWVFIAAAIAWMSLQAARAREHALEIEQERRKVEERRKDRIAMIQRHLERREQEADQKKRDAETQIQEKEKQIAAAATDNSKLADLVNNTFGDAE
jgi:hypothetical protein